MIFIIHLQIWRYIDKIHLIFAANSMLGWTILRQLLLAEKKLSLQVILMLLLGLPEEKVTSATSNAVYSI